MKLHAIQTGCVRIKPAQVEGRGRGLRRRLSVTIDRDWTAWLPTYAWVIDHPEGVIVVDTGQGAHLLESSRSLHPYHRWGVEFRLEREEEIGPQLRALGVGRRDIKCVVLTHLHVDHDGGLAHFPDTEVLVSPGELRAARGWAGRLRGYLPNRWPTWFDPKPLDLAPERFGPFSTSRRLTAAGDVIAVATPGHTANHVSVVVEDQAATYFLAGDTSYNQRLMWISSSTEIATVNAGGQVTGRSHGSTTVTASYAGGSATLLVHVVNNYAGTWNGQDIIRTCTDSGDLTDHDGGWCAGGAGKIGTARPMEVVLEQTGNTLSEISGTIGNVPGTVLTGVVTPEGRLILRGSWNVLDWDGNVVAVDGIRDWDTNLTAPGVMAGRWSEDYKSVLFRIGSASMASDITMSRSSPWDYVVQR